MFCPQCGLQSSDEIRFCPRCGLSLAPHAALLTGHAPAQSGPGMTQSLTRTAKRVGSRRAAKLMFFGAALFPLFLLLAGVSDHPGPLMVPAALFFVGLMWLLYARLFGEDTPRAVHQTARKDLRAGAEKPALGAPQFVPASPLNRRADTAEMAPPPSVTENTTRLLDKDA